MVSRSTLGKRVADLFFRNLHDDVFQCRCGIKRKKSGSSYTNLVSHIRAAHPDYESLISEDPSDSQARIEAFFQSSKSNRLYSWFRLVIMTLLPFSFIEHPVVRDIARHKSICLSTFMTYLPRVTENVEAKVSGRLPNTFAL
eukprot:IDg4726t1